MHSWGDRLTRLVSGVLSRNSRTITSENWFDSGLLFVLAGVSPCGCGLRVESRGQEGKRRRRLEIPGRKTEKRVVFRALCKTSNRSSLARSVDVRVVGPLGQMASHIASHMVCISPHCPRPSSNWQVMYRCSGLSPPPSLLASSRKRHSDVVVMVAEVIVVLSLARCHREARRWHFIQRQVLPRCSFQERLPRFCRSSFFSPRPWKVNQSRSCYRRLYSIWLRRPTPIPGCYIHDYRLIYIRAHTIQCVLHHSSLHLSPCYPTVQVFFSSPLPPITSLAAYFTASLFESLLSITIHQRTCVCHKLQGPRNYITIIYTLNKVQKELLYTTFNHAPCLMFIILSWFSTAAGQWKPDYRKTTST